MEKVFTKLVDFTSNWKTKQSTCLHKPWQKSIIIRLKFISKQHNYLQQQQFLVQKQQQNHMNLDQSTSGIQIQARLVLTIDAQHVCNVSQQILLEFYTNVKDNKGIFGSNSLQRKHWNPKMALEDDQGKVHTFLIPTLYYVLEGGVRLLSPQHWAQTQKDIKPNSGTMEITIHQLSTLYWKKGKFERTVMLIKHNNVAIFWLALGFREFEAYEDTTGFHEASNSHPFIAYQVHIIEEEETSYYKPANPWKSEPLHVHHRKVDVDVIKHISTPSNQ